VYVTHDQVEAMTLGERVAVLRDGMLQQVDTPQRLYQHPANLFVAAFIGSPPMNLVGATIGGGAVRFAGFEIPIPGDLDLTGIEGRDVILGIRPADLEDAAVWSGSSLPTITVLADVTEDLGSEVNVLFAVDAPPVRTDETLAASEQEGEGEIPLIAEERAVFCARVDPRTSCGPGTPIRLSIDPRRFHFFDPPTGLALSPASVSATAVDSRS
jgi:multiple sugar transport system ATP-binding protein